MNYLPILIAISGIILPIVGGAAVFMYFLRRDILQKLNEDSGIIVQSGAKRHMMRERRAPRVIDDATAFAIEKEQAERNSRDYR